MCCCGSRREALARSFRAESLGAPALPGPPAPAAGSGRLADLPAGGAAGDDARRHEPRADGLVGAGDEAAATAPQAILAVRHRDGGPIVLRGPASGAVHRFAAGAVVAVPAADARALVAGGSFEVVDRAVDGDSTT
ncbi:MAG TPA: hypothetical protein PKC43_10000 [Phycisphaerales bacterium]|mgnify:CR=1 FL=1|nr:hypothetical protein [Phycisphaerales bacterium]HMP37767.1 hypothetical protein [Phycisphaerales bacterium]